MGKVQPERLVWSVLSRLTNPGMTEERHIKANKRKYKALTQAPMEKRQRVQGASPIEPKIVETHQLHDSFSTRFAWQEWPCASPKNRPCNGLAYAVPGMNNKTQA
jgi:hypothetical protein